MNVQVERLAALSARLRQHTGTLNLQNWCECACGIAGTMYEFNILGFKLGLLNDKRCNGPIYEANGRREEEWSAVESFFGIDDLISDMLFYYVGCGTKTKPTDVADRIDQFLAGLKQPEHSVVCYAIEEV